MGDFGWNLKTKGDRGTQVGAMKGRAAIKAQVTNIKTQTQVAKPKSMTREQTNFKMRKHRTRLNSKIQVII